MKKFARMSRSEASKCYIHIRLGLWYTTWPP
jgi:hypothetical protein